MEKILILTDFSRKSADAAELAITIAEKSNSDLLLLNALQLPETIAACQSPYGYYQDLSTLEKNQAEKMEEFSRNIESKVAERRSGEQTLSVIHTNKPGSLGETIRDVLDQRQSIWLIVMGDKTINETILSRFIFGSDSFSVISHAACPVLLVPRRVRKTRIESIVFASNLESSDLGALRQLVHFARFTTAKIIVTHLYTRPVTTEAKEKAYETYRDITKNIDYSYLSFQDCDETFEGISGRVARLVAKVRPDLLAMVNRKHPFFETIFHQSAMQRMVDHHRIPVLIFPAITR